MAGRRLLDAARLFGASRSIAKHHYVLRSQQWDVFTQTSTLAKAVKNQTDRVTVTARAAYAIAKRFNEQGPSYGSGDRNAYQTPTQYDDTSIPRQETVQGTEGTTGNEEGLKQDHHYTRSDQNSAVDPPLSDDLEVRQEKADRYPLPDGTIPPSDSNLGEPVNSRTKDTFAERPVSESSKDPLSEAYSSAQSDLDVIQEKAKSYPSPDGTIPPDGTSFAIPVLSDRAASSSEHNMKAQRQSEFQIPSFSGVNVASTPGSDTFNTRPQDSSAELSSLPRMKIPKSVEDAQGGDEHIEAGINQDVFYSSKGHALEQAIPSQEAVPEQNELPEGINTDIFHSPRVAGLINSRGKEDRRRAYEMKMKASRGTSINERPVAQDKNQDNSSARQSTSVPPTEPVQLPTREAVSQPQTKESEEDIKAFADSLAQDATAGASSMPETPAEVADQPGSTAYKLRESRVPSSRFGRLWQYGGLATSMAFGAVGESFRRVTSGGGDNPGSLMLSPANMERLVAKLSRMRGAALKLGQMVSFQGKFVCVKVGDSDIY